MIDRWLFTRIDNSALILFRILFGGLIAIEAFGAILTGWVRRILIEPEFTFNFIGFGFLQPLPGNGMLWYYGTMGFLGLLIMLGFRYRMSMLAFALLWSGVYLMQKSSYNNHYYLLMLLSYLMVLVPAHRFLSVDAWLRPAIRRIHMPRWVWLLIVLQLWIVYTFAAVAKIYPDWFSGRLPALLMETKKDYWLVGPYLQQEWVPYAIAYFGFCFDLLIIPLLLYRKTRMGAFLASVFFHLFNSLIFQIGIFPYLSLAFILFFFPSEQINRLFLRWKPHFSGTLLILPSYRRPLRIFLVIWFSIQVLLPIRHWFIQDDVLWTEEGHRLSWRMMLRSKSGIILFKVVDKERPKDTLYIQNNLYLTPKQQKALATKPDLIWQFAQHLEKDYAKQGREIEVYVESQLSVNGRPYVQYIDPHVDLAAEQWRYFRHSPWILPAPKE